MADDVAIGQHLIFGRGERAHGLGQHLEVVDVKRDLARFGAEHDTAGLDKIADVEGLVEKVEAFATELVGTEEELDLACPIFDMGEGDLTHGTGRADAPCERDADFLPGLFGSLESCDGLGACVRPFGARRICVDPLGAQLFDLLQADLFERGIFWHRAT